MKRGSSFLSHYRRTRSLASLWIGIPSLILTPLTISVLWLASAEDMDLNHRIFLKAAEYIQMNRKLTASLCYRRVLRADPDNSAAQFGIAELWYGTGDEQRAERAMRRLAPLPEGGFGPAHHWLAMQRIKSAAELTDAEAEVFDGDLAISFDQDLLSPEEISIFSRRLYENNKTEEAATVMESAARQDRAFQLELAMLRFELNHLPRSQQAAQLAEADLKDRLSSFPKDITLIVRHATALSLIGQFKRAAEDLERATRLLPPRGRQPAQWNEVMHGWSRLVKTATRTDKRNLPFALEALDRVMNLAPGHPLTMQTLNDLTRRSARTARLRKIMRETLEEAVAAGNSNSTIHLTLGNLDFMEDDRESARKQFELANKLNPRSPAVANNLAWSLATTEPPQLEQALELSNFAVSSSPDDGEYRDTRGQILCLLERWPDAIVDLEKALAILPPRKSIHESLAKAYAELKEPKLAEIHRRTAVELAAP